MSTLRNILCMAAVTIESILDHLVNVCYDIYYLIYDGWYYGTLQTLLDAILFGILIFIMYLFGFVL